MKTAALLNLPMLVLLAAGWLLVFLVSCWSVVRGRWPWLMREWPLVGLLSVLNLGFFWRVLLTRDTWLPKNGGDFNAFYYPLYHYAGQQMAAGNFPLWNPSIWSGTPFAANQQTGLFAPLNLLAFLLARPFTYDTLQWLVIIQIWLASLTAYAFCRDLGVRRVAALIGGITFAYSGFAISHLGHYPMIAVIPWLPLVLLCLRRALVQRSLVWTIGTALALLLALLGGHQQIFLYLLTATGLYWLFLTWTTSPAATWPGERRTVRRWLAGRFAGHWIVATAQLGLAGLLAVGLAAPALVPSLQLAGLSIRSGISYTEATAFSLRPLHLLTLLVPKTFGSTPDTYINAVGFSGEVWGYAGVIALALAAFAFVRSAGPQRQLAWFFVGLAALSLLVALGPATPVQGWFYAFVPGYSRVRASGRWLLLVDLALATLAALGAENLLRLLAADAAGTARLLQQYARLLAFGLGVGLVLVLGGYGVLLSPRDPSGPLAQMLDSAIWVLVLLGLLTLLGFLVYRQRLSSRLVALALAALVCLDLFAASAPVPPTTDNPLASFHHPEAATLIRSSGRSDGLFRVDQTKMVENGWQPAWVAVLGLESIGGNYDPLGLASYSRYFEEIRQRYDSPLYDLLNIHYLILPLKDTPSGGDKYREVGRGQDFVVYENRTALPRAFLVGEGQPAGTSEAAWSAITRQGFDPRTTAILTSGAGNTGLPRELHNGQPQGAVAVSRPNSDELTATVQTDREAVLVFSEIAYPGWQATIDGVATPLLTADYLFRAVTVPAGNHTVHLTFAPPLWRNGWIIAAGTAGIVVALLVVVLLQRRRRAGMTP